MDEDSLLIRRMKKGDEDAIEVFVRKYYPVILRYCRVHMDDAGYAEDVTQETFARFFRTLNQYKHYGKAANYLYVIAGSCCKDHYRKQREIPLEELPEQICDGMEQRLGIKLALLGLPKELREVAILYFVQEVKQRQIAAILGISLPLVKYRIRRARELLAASLREEEL